MLSNGDFGLRIRKYDWAGLEDKLEYERELRWGERSFVIRFVSSVICLYTSGVCSCNVCNTVACRKFVVRRESLGS